MSLQEERTKIFKDVYRGKVPKRVPIKIEFEPGYAIEYAGYDLRKGQLDLALMQDSFDKLAGGVNSDTLPVKYGMDASVLQIMGAKNYVMSDDGVLQHPEINTMDISEYDDYIGDPLKFIHEKVMTRFHTNLDTKPEKRAITLAKAFSAFNERFYEMTIHSEKVIAKHKLAELPDGILTETPFDFLGNALRGFMGIAMDTQDIPDKIKQACIKTLPLLARIGVTENPTIDARCDIPLHYPTYLSTNDFEKLYFPTFKKLIEYLVDSGMGVNLFLENDWIRYIDYLQDLPDNIFLEIENGDPKAFKEKIGSKHIIAGFFPIELLRSGTKKECTEKAGELIDILAPGGKYIFSWNKTPMGLGDAKPENISAVTKFVRERGVY